MYLANDLMIALPRRNLDWRAVCFLKLQSPFPNTTNLTMASFYCLATSGTLPKLPVSWFSSRSGS